MSSGADYEHADVSARPIVQATIALTVGIVVALFLVWMTYARLREVFTGRDARRSQIQSVEAPPPPRLEVSPTADYEAYLNAQMKTLQSYGWVSKDEGKARIPIRRAMEMLLEGK
jgi:hypothetical protein